MAPAPCYLTPTAIDVRAVCLKNGNSRPFGRCAAVTRPQAGLHKTLLDSERSSYERDIARITSSGGLLKLVLYDPWFAWLHELSEFVVLIDEILDANQPPGGIDAERLIAQAWDLLAPDETGAGYARRYFEALQRDPDVVLAHGRMRKLLASLG